MTLERDVFVDSAYDVARTSKNETFNCCTGENNGNQKFAAITC